jgi:hypothetical protein
MRCPLSGVCTRMILGMLDQWEIGVGTEYVQSIERGVDEAEFVIVLLTLASVASNWVDREWRRKFQKETQTKRIAVVPVRGESCEIPDFLAHRSQADVPGGSYPLGFRHLLTILRHYSVEVSDAGTGGSNQLRDPRLRRICAPRWSSAYAASSPSATPRVGPQSIPRASSICDGLCGITCRS